MAPTPSAGPASERGRRAPARLAPASRLAAARTARLALAPLTILLLATALAPAAPAAEPPLLGEFCPTGSAGGQCRLPRGVAVDATSGEVYVADRSNYRIQRFTAWGELQRIWGWEVVASGPDDEAAKNEVQELTVDATGGGYGLEVFASGLGGYLKTGTIQANASAGEVQGALLGASGGFGEKLEPGDVSVSGGPGDEGGTTPYTLEFEGQFANTEVPRLEAVKSTLSGGGATAGLATVQDGGSFEVCVPAEEDVCRGGQESVRAGGQSGAQGMALDSEGDVYVVDRSNRRVQKFSPAGEFLLTVGGEVNKTKVEEAKPAPERNRCPVDPGDVCRAGTQGAGAGQFAFNPNAVGSFIGVDGKGTAESSDDTIYVGDEGRVQEFDSDGHHLGDLPDPDGVLAAGGTVNSLAVDPGSGALYLGFFRAVSTPESKPDLHKLNAAGEEQCTIEAHNPSAIAVGPGGEVYVVEGDIALTPPTPREVTRFDSSCGGREALFGPELGSGEDQFSANPTGIAASAACREEGEAGTDLFVSNPDFSNSFVKLFGPPPDADLCPAPEKPPLIAEQFAASVAPEGAVVRAKISPRFWPDTAYRVQYATAGCLGEAEDWGAGCVEEQPDAAGILLSEATTSSILATKGVFLGASGALAPDTAYRYRFLAQSGGGGPVYGLGGGEAEEAGGETSYRELGAASAFHTPPLPAAGKADCANGAFRTGASAPLPDCRAYELVSPTEKNNGDLSSPRLEFIDQAAADGEALSFGATAAFGDPEGAPLASQYLSRREADGWSTRSINAPRSSVPLLKDENIATRFKAFDASLCSGWLLQDTDTPLVGGEVPRGVTNLYRSRGLRPGCAGEGGYELLSTVFPPGYEPALEKGQSLYYPQIQGFSADGAVSVFRAAAALAEDACKAPTTAGPEGKGIFQVYLNAAGVPGVAPKLISKLPSGAPACTHSSAGASQSPYGLLNTSEDSLHHALSEDAARAYWTATSGGAPPTNLAQAGAGPGKLYLRLNPGEAQSALEHGGAQGKGDLIGPATATGKATINKEFLSGVEVQSGEFAVGQQIADSANRIPAATTIEAIEEEPLTPLEEELGKERSGRFKLFLSAKATGTKIEDELTGLASEVVSNLSISSGAFEEGQRIAGAGIPFGTTVLSCAPACGEEASSLTLSAEALETRAAVGLEAWSACTEPAKACTLPVSAEAEALSGTSASRFLDAAADGSTAIFQSGSELYEYDLAKALAGEAATTPIAHKSLGIMGASNDASRLYLITEEALGGEGVEGAPNLYLRERGGGAAFVATLGGAKDASVGEENQVSSSIARYPRKRASRVSPDGLHAAFVSADPALAESVAGYDNADAASGRADREIYLYDATAGGGAGSLICASCNPSAARPTGRATETPNSDPASWVWSAARLPGWDTALVPGGALSADGSRLFFESFEPLVARDTNGVGDVYEWERAASGEECLAGIGGELYVAASGGCLSLISSGQGADDAELVDASANGRDVFIFTSERLAGADNDGFNDIYDARAGGGFAAPAAAEPPCEGEACQSPAAAPESSTPASSSFQGPGNVTEGAAGRCAKPARRAKALSRRAKRLRRSAHKLARDGSRAKAGALHRRAARYARQARRQSHQAKRCRRRARDNRRARR